MEMIRTVELFAGVGGFRLGLEAASDNFRIDKYTESRIYT